jgi:TATA-box binding protein (TBP) (component of TFIID and TFIIIB)
VLKEIITNIVNRVKTYSPELVIKSYKGEFEPEGEWNPVFPSCFYRLSKFGSSEATTSGSILKYSGAIEFLVGTKSTEELECVDLCESIFNTLNGYQIPLNVLQTVDIQNVVIAPYGYAPGGVEIYSVTLKIGM